MTSAVTLSRVHHNNNSNYCVTNYSTHYSNDIPITTLNCSDIGIDVTNYGISICSASQQSCSSQSSTTSTSTSANNTSVPLSSSSVITIPFGWKRELIDGVVIYYSPTDCALTSLNEIASYLESEGTCKCGLECPLIINRAFNFDPCVTSKVYNISDANTNIATKLCNHKRKTIALATYKQHSDALIAQQQQQQQHLNDKYDKHLNHGKCDEALYCDNNADYNYYEQQNVSKASAINENLQNVETVSVIHANQNTDHTNCHLVAHNLHHYHNEDNNCISSQQYLQQTNNDNISHFSLPISCGSHCDTSGQSMALQIQSSEHIPQTNSFCVYDNSGQTSGMYSFSPCDSTQLNEKTSIYLTPPNATNYGQVISYENANVNLIQTSQQTYANQYNHHSDSSSNIQTTITSIPLINNTQSYIPLHTSHNTSNTGEISFNSCSLSPTVTPFNLSTAHNHSQQHTRNNISILPQNPPMPPLSVPNVTTVTTSVTDVIPAVGVAPQLINSGNSSGAPQVLQFINSVPLTQISANTVTVLQQTPTREVPSATLLIPQLMPSHEHSVVINHALAQQTAMYPHIAAATNLAALPNAFQNIGIAPTISLPHRNCIADNSKPFTRTRKRKEYNRTNRSHPPTVASILKQAADNEKKQKELSGKQQSNDNECIIDSSRSVAVQSESQSDLQSDNENLVNNICTNNTNSDVIQSKTQCNLSYDTDLLTGDNLSVLQSIQIESNHDENPISDVSSEQNSPTSECFHGTGSDSGVESEPTSSNMCVNCEQPGSQQVVDSSRQRSLKRLKRLRKELSVYYGNENSDDESPQSPPLPPQLRTFNTGDLVWGQMGDVRFWPGKLVADEELVGLSIKKEEGKLIVKWFGDHTFTQVEPENLKTLSEGLEEHHCARKRHRSGKRMNSFLEQAIQEAMQELDRQSNDISTNDMSESSTVLGVVTSTQTVD